MSTLISGLSPGEVLEQQAALAAQLQHPSPWTADYYREWMQRTVTSRDGRAESVFYPLVPVGYKGEVGIGDGHDMAVIIGNNVEEAVPHQVTAEMVRAMRATYEAGGQTVSHVDLAELPCPAGFAWLDEPWPIRDVHLQTVLVRATSWKYLTARTRGTEHDQVPIDREWPCVRVCLWCHYLDDIAAGLSYEDARAGVARVGELTAVHQAVVPFGLRFTAESLKIPAAESFLGLVHHLWMYLGMEIVSSDPVRPPRHFRRRAQRHAPKIQPAVRVVMLRKIRHHTEPDGHHLVDWSCRWPVQGHYRHHDAPVQPHRALASGVTDGDQLCAVCEGVLHWVRPYLKGPDGLPLKVSKTLLKLAR